MHSSVGDVAKQLRSECDKQREHNRSALKRIIRAVEFHGRLGLPLRGHNDSGKLPVIKNDQDEAEQQSIDYSKGNV